jgi:hypothetical protein
VETARRFVEGYPTRLAAYLAFECALMQRYIARGGTAEEFCLRLAPLFHRRYAPLLLDATWPRLPAPSRPGRLTRRAAPSGCEEAACGDSDRAA